MRHSVAYFNPKLNTFHFNIISLSLCSADVKVFEKKNQIFFCPQKVEKKTPQKVADHGSQIADRSKNS